MERKVRWIAGGAAGVALLVAGAGVAAANDSGDDDDRDTAITGAALERASDAALAETGGGEVTETEAGDEESAYEVEVTLDDGTEVDVQLDESFEVVSTSTDDDHGDADDAGEVDD